MKKQLLLAGAAVVITAGVIGGGVAVSTHYRDYKNKQILTAQNQAEQQSKAQEAEKNAQLSRENALETEVQDLTKECLKGKAIYATLPVASQKKVQAPDCGL